MVVIATAAHGALANPTAPASNPANKPGFINPGQTSATAVEDDNDKDAEDDEPEWPGPVQEEFKLILARDVMDRMTRSRAMRWSGQIRDMAESGLGDCESK